jgi:mannose-1-phosphate guanylyltransferase/mannose-6-phosphate isomerase
MILPVIMSGGSGTRLWPLSRSQDPKPFIKLADGESLIQKTYKRAASLDGVYEVLTITNSDYFLLSKDEWEPLSESHSDLKMPFLLEPEGRNTAPAIAMSAFYAMDFLPEDTVLLVLAADHLINDHVCFSNTVELAKKHAMEGKLVTFGIQPTHANTGYGYIQYNNENCSTDPDELIASDVIRFVEKPSKEVAEKYLDSGDFVWNSGMFCFKAETFLDSLKQHSPEIYNASKVCWEISKNENIIAEHLVSIEFEKESFSQIPDDSVDYAVMEKSDNVMVIPSNMEWSDIGSWNEMGNLTEIDLNGNRIEGEAILIDVQNSYFKSSNRVLTSIGVSDIMVVDTADALLIAHKDRVQDINQVVNVLKLQNHESTELHRTVKRPWGTYTILDEGPNFKIKRIEVKPNACLSLQMHHHRSEHWVIISGTAKVLNNDKEMILKVNDSTYIPAEHKHRLENTGTEMLAIIEVQTGTYLGENDIVRFHDVYGRN